MVQLKPHFDNSLMCPECGTDKPIVDEIRFESVNILADCACAKCGFEFYQTLPVGHMVGYSFSIAKGKLYTRDNDDTWLSQSLLNAHGRNRKDDVSIEKIIFKEYDKVVILNTLDSLYGHVLLKLYNAFYHLEQQKEIGLIIIIPKIFKWLIPAGCAEAWVVDLKLNDLVYSYAFIQKFVSNELNRFQEVYLSKAYSHPQLSVADIERLTGVNPFKLENFYTNKPTITFILREDRWWFKSLGDYWFYRVCRNLKILPWGSRMLSRRQNQLVKKTIRYIKKLLPEANIHIVGLGKTGDFDGYAKDERQWTVNAEVEKMWCNIYAQSHLVIGVHGSNMLLPTALAAGCIEVLPEDRYGNMIQDITVRYNNRLQLFFYRFVDQFDSPKSIGCKAVAMIRDYRIYNQNMCLNTYPLKVADDDSVNS